MPNTLETPRNEIVSGAFSAGFYQAKDMVEKYKHNPEFLEGFCLALTEQVHYPKIEKLKNDE